MSAWNPTQYLKFGGERLQPAIDMLAHVSLQDVDRAYDLGCGTGNATRLLRERWLAARITGVDSSRAMLARAQAEVPGIEWTHADIAAWLPPAQAALIFSNAALHWLPDHEILFPRLMSWLAPGGVLAVQMPRNFRAPSHALVEEVARNGPWRHSLEPQLRADPVDEPLRYLDWLQPLANSISIWETEYLHLLKGADPVKEWVKSTWLKPLLDVLDDDQRHEFEAEYAKRVRVAYPQRADGITPFPFKRLFVIAQRKW